MTEHEQVLQPDTDGLSNPIKNDGVGVWFFVEYKDGKVDEGCLRLASEGKNLADKLGEDSVALIIGNQVINLVDSFGLYGTDRAIVIEDPHLETYAGETYVDILTQLVELDKPSIILFSTSTIGNDLAPRLAAKLHAPLVARYTEIDVDSEQRITVRRSIHGGNAYATVTPLGKPLIGTIDTQILGDQKSKVETEPDVFEARLRIDPKTSYIQVIDYLRADPCAVCVSEAEIVIGVGKGLGCADNLQAVEELARVLGASIGGSRRATDERWISDERRIGLTGKTITPILYLICGISGAFHHTLSIKGAKHKIAVNMDANAPISKLADLMVVGNMQEIIPELTKQLRDILKPNT